MAIKSDPLDTPFGAWCSENTDVDENAVDDVRNGKCRIEAVTVVNGAAAVNYVKIYDHTGPTVGGTAPVLTLPVPASVTRTFELRQYDADGNYEGGIQFKNGVSYACVSDGGGTAGTTAPASAVQCFWTFNKY